MRLSQALEVVPRVLPPQVCAMLSTGDRIGDIRKVLPACRLLLRDSVSHVRSALNYLILLAFAISPAMVVVPVVLEDKVLPKLKAVFAGMLEGQPARVHPIGLRGKHFVMVIQLCIVGFVWLATLAYCRRATAPRLGPSPPAGLHRTGSSPGCRGGANASSAISRPCSPCSWTPKCPKPKPSPGGPIHCQPRHYRPRAESLRPAARRSQAPEALRALDSSQELQWRLSNALRRGAGFVRALTGWHEALDAKAFQLEQAAAQITTTVLVLINGVIVASILIAVFLILISIINRTSVW